MTRVRLVVAVRLALQRITPPVSRFAVVVDFFILEGASFLRPPPAWRSLAQVGRSSSVEASVLTARAEGVTFESIAERLCEQTPTRKESNLKGGSST